VKGGPELDPKLARLLAEERRASDFPEEKREEFFAKIVGAVPGNGDGGAPPPEGSGSAARARVLGVKLLKAGALLAVGATLGYVARGPGSIATAPPTAASAVAPAASRPVDEEQVAPAEVDASAASEPKTSPVSGLTPPASKPQPRGAEPLASPSASSRSTLSQERALVERARAAIARRDGLSALEALTEHERAFPNGKLAEERDALFVQALALAGRSDDARRRALQFESRYPTSMFAGRVDATLRELPPAASGQR
jgi:hypothetical protein